MIIKLNLIFLKKYSKIYQLKNFSKLLKFLKNHLNNL